jgi:hypothetical protein
MAIAAMTAMTPARPAYAQYQEVRQRLTERDFKFIVDYTGLLHRDAEIRITDVNATSGEIQGTLITRPGATAPITGRIEIVEATGPRFGPRSYKISFTATSTNRLPGGGTLSSVANYEGALRLSRAGEDRSVFMAGTYSVTGFGGERSGPFPFWGIGPERPG